jgi:4-hydroxybenzoate decarboxylase subunit C
MFTDLQEFLAVLRKEGDLLDIFAPVDAHLEIAQIHRRVIAESGPALLFHNVIGSPFPLVTNLFGTAKRVELAFGTRPFDLLKQVAKLPEELLPPTASALWSKRSLFAQLAKVGTRKLNHGLVTDVVESPPKLTKLPLLTTWQEDGGPFVTLPLVYTEHPKNGTHNLGMYRIQRFDDATTGLHFQIGKGAGFHLAEAEAIGTPLPVTISIGGPPALIVSAIAPLPENVPELLLASLLMGKKVNMVKSPLSQLPILADAEFVLSGYCNPSERRPEGPFGDHYGYYSLKHDYPVFHCTHLFRKRKPVCAATVVGKPRQEDFFIGDYLQELLSPLFPLVMPAVEDLWSYGETGFHSLSAARVKQRYKKEAMVSAFRILGEGQLSLTKFLLLTDQRVNLKDFRSLLEVVLERAVFETDLYLFTNLSMDTLDYTGPAVNEGSKGVLLGMGDPIRCLPAALSNDLPNFVNGAAVFCRGCLVVETASFASFPNAAQLLVESGALADWPLVVITDNCKRATESEMNFLWTTFTRFNPGADIYSNQKLVSNHVSHSMPVIIDARMKPWYPAELECDPDTERTVNKRWKEYFPGAGL